MKNKMDVLFLAVVGMFFAFTLAHAAPVRSPKKNTFVCNGLAGNIGVVGTNISSVTTFNVWDSTNSVTKPGAVYQIILGTGTIGDYFVLYDTNTAQGITVGSPTTGNQIGPRLYISSSGYNTTFQFDPPLVFFNGLLIGESAPADQAGVTWEAGRGLSGE